MLISIVHRSLPLTPTYLPTHLICQIYKVSSTLINGVVHFFVSLILRSIDSFFCGYDHKTQKFSRENETICVLYHMFLLECSSKSLSKYQWWVFLLFWPMMNINNNHKSTCLWLIFVLIFLWKLLVSQGWPWPSMKGYKTRNFIVLVLNYVSLLWNI